MLLYFWAFFAAAQSGDEQVYTVRYKDNLTFTEKVQARAFLRTQLGGAAKAAGADSFNDIHEYSIFNGFFGSFSPELASMLAQHPSFERVEQDFVIRLASPLRELEFDELEPPPNNYPSLHPLEVSDTVHDVGIKASSSFAYRGASILGCADTSYLIPLRYFFDGDKGFPASYENCIATCQLGLDSNSKQGFRYAAAGSNDCYCGDEILHSETANTCNIPCKGNPLQTCGDDRSLIILGPIDPIEALSNEQTDDTLRQATTKRSIDRNHDASLLTSEQSIDKYDTQGWTALRVLGYDTTDESAQVPVCRLPYTEVDVYVLDSGVNVLHTELEGRVIRAKGYFYGHGMDFNGHGTHVTSNIVGKTLGLAKRVKVISVKVLDSEGNGNGHILMHALEWVHNQYLKRRKPTVINLSFSTMDYSENLNELIEKISEDITVVVAAGNHQLDACSISPASSSAVVTVGATGAYQDGKVLQDHIAVYSNYGPCVDIFAPGSDQAGAGLGANDFREMSGTSVAAPLVASVAALLLEQRPYATPTQVKEQLLRLTAPDIVKGDLYSASNRLLQVDPDRICDLWS